MCGSKRGSPRLVLQPGPDGENCVCSLRHSLSKCLPRASCCPGPCRLRGEHETQTHVFVKLVSQELKADIKQISKKYSREGREKEESRRTLSFGLGSQEEFGPP